MQAADRQGVTRRRLLQGALAVASSPLWLPTSSRSRLWGAEPAAGPLRRHTEVPLNAEPPLAERLGRAKIPLTSVVPLISGVLSTTKSLLMSPVAVRW